MFYRVCISPPQWKPKGNLLSYFFFPEIKSIIMLLRSQSTADTNRGYREQRSKDICTLDLIMSDQEKDKNNASYFGLTCTLPQV